MGSIYPLYLSLPRIPLPFLPLSHPPSFELSPHGANTLSRQRHGNAGGAAAILGSASAASLLVFDSVLYLSHLVVILGLGKLLRIPLSDTLLARSLYIHTHIHT